MKTQIGLGVLSIPSVFDTLGMIPGVILLCIVAGIATWTSYMVGVFKIRHREIYGIDEAGGLMFGRMGREVFGIGFSLCKWCFLCFSVCVALKLTFSKDWIFVAGSGILGISISLNAISDHGTCTAAFVGVAAVIGFSLASIRTLGKITWIAWVGLVCILSAGRSLRSCSQFHI